MKSAISPFWDGQKDAMPSYVTRPNRSISADLACSMESRSSSSPQTYSCQSISQLLGPSKKPSSVTRFHMKSFLTFVPPCAAGSFPRSEEHTSELQSQSNLV